MKQTTEQPNTIPDTCKHGIDWDTDCAQCIAILNNGGTEKDLITEPVHTVQCTETDLRTIEALYPSTFIIVCGNNGGGCTLYKSNKPRHQAASDADKLIDNGDCDYAEILSIKKAVATLLD